MTPSERLLNFAKELREKRDAATLGEWVLCHHLKVDHCPCGTKGTIWSKDKDALVFTVGDNSQEQAMIPQITDEKEYRGNARFSVHAANNAHAIAEVIEVLVKALSFYSMNGSSDRYTATEWKKNSHMLLTFGKFGELEEKIPPWMYSEQALERAVQLLEGK